MINQNLIDGTYVTLEEMLDARERRSQVQEQILKMNPYPVISFTLNIAGPIKVFPLSIQTYEEGVALIRNHIKAWGLKIIHFEEIRDKTGYEAFFSVKSQPKRLKEIMLSLENQSTLGRLFDIDVLDENGTKISRTELGLPERTCLLCDKDVFLCSRSRTHTVPALFQRTCEIMWNYFSMQYARKNASIAARALLYEVAATPKPGLVDRRNTGSHTDMDIHTFDSSAIALLPYFIEFIQAGIFSIGQEPEALFQYIRPIGIKAELAMLKATKGVNTHKGIIFSLGIICAALGRLYGLGRPDSRENIMTICQEMTSGLKDDFKHVTLNTAATHGEILYAKYGIMGVRKEAMEGFPVAFKLALPKFEEFITSGLSHNDAGVLTLLYIMAYSEDTNIITRSDYETFRQIQEDLRNYLNSENPFPKDFIEYAEQLDESFIHKNISPGGSADILALTYFLYFYEKEK